MRAVKLRSCAVSSGDPANGTPPLLYHGGPIMDTASTSPVVITPIFWSPAGHPIDNAYKAVIKRYWSDVAAASGSHTNVYSTMNQYTGSNGQASYNITAAAPITDTHALPTSGCTVAANDTSGIYADNSGYNACLDDAQVVAETERIRAKHSGASDYAHIYMLYLPKHVESCFDPGETTSSANACTINNNPSGAYCAYHGQNTATGMVYANMPFPIYSSPTFYTCSSEATLPTNESPNHNVDADVEISPASHEVMEAITDPDVSTGWYDSSGYENGDECAYTYGPTQGTPGALYNQKIGTHKYLTQEEFSNLDYASSGGAGGCLQSEAAPVS